MIIKLIYVHGCTIVQVSTMIQSKKLIRVSRTFTFKYKHEKPEPRRQAIILYIIKYDGCNMTQLIDYMERKLEEKPSNEIYASVKTTYKIVNELVKDKVIISSIIKKNRRERHLHINHKHSIIYNELDNIESLISTIIDPMPNLNKIRVEMVITLLRSLSYYVKGIKLPTYESDTFNREIMRLNRKLSEQVYNSEYAKEVLRIYKNKLVKLKQDPDIKNSSYNIKIIDDLVKFEEDFNKKFLS
jgi:hypothetical protein